MSYCCQSNSTFRAHASTHSAAPLLPGRGRDDEHRLTLCLPGANCSCTDTILGRAPSSPPRCNSHQVSQGGWDTMAPVPVDASGFYDASVRTAIGRSASSHAIRGVYSPRRTSSAHRLHHRPCHRRRRPATTAARAAMPPPPLPPPPFLRRSRRRQLGSSDESRSTRSSASSPAAGWAVCSGSCSA